MTRRGPRKPVDAAYWKGRLDVARGFLSAARQDAELAEPGAPANPILSHIVVAAIAYGDAATAFLAQVVNQQDHSTAARLLREVLGNALPAEHERAFQRLLGSKDAAQYGARPIRIQEASSRLADLEKIAQFVEDLVRG